MLSLWLDEFAELHIIKCFPDKGWANRHKKVPVLQQKLGTSCQVYKGINQPQGKNGMDSLSFTSLL